MNVTLVGIAGGSAAGKTTLAAGLATRLGNRLAVLEFDCYYRDHGHLSVEDRALVNYDHPRSLDAELFVSHLDDLVAGQAIEAPIYDFATHTRTSATETVGPCPVVVVAGILLLAFPSVRQRLDLVVYVDTPAEVRLERRVVRDVAERGRTEDSVRAQFATTVVPMHEEWVAPFVSEVDLILDGLRDPEKTIKAVLGCLGESDRELR
ncbi:MAG: uridine kinase [Actinomycetota bacterium]|nr:uridine kinase [Actinomycetota bacterium]